MKVTNLGRYGILDVSPFVVEVLTPNAVTEATAYKGVRFDLPVWELTGSAEEIAQYMQDWRDRFPPTACVTIYDAHAKDAGDGQIVMWLAWYIEVKQKEEGRPSMYDVIMIMIKEDLEKK